MDTHKLKITFPDYFIDNNRFNSLFIEENQFVNYIHNSNSIKDVELSIDRNFFLYVSKGQVKLTSTKGTKIVDSKKAAIITKGGYIMSESLADIDDEFFAFLFFLPDELIKDFCIEMDIPPSNYSSETPVYSIEISNSIHHYIESISLLLNNKPKTTNPFIKLKAKELLHLIYAENNQKVIQAIFSQNNSPEELKIEKVMEENYCRKITIDQIAFLCGMSVSNFKRKFESIYGISPGKWVKEKKLLKAKQLLANSNKAIAIICHEVGFDNVSHFSQSFKSRFGVSPSRHKN